MIALREAAAALLDEPERQEWLNLEWRAMVLAKRAQYRVTLDLRHPELPTIEGMEAEVLSPDEINRLSSLRARLIGAVLYQLRTGGWPQSQAFQDGNVNPVSLSADWWNLQHYPDLWGGMVRWKDAELSDIMVDVPTTAEAPPSAEAPGPAAPPPPPRSALSSPGRPRGRPRYAPERDRVTKLILACVDDAKTHTLGRSANGMLTLVDLASGAYMKQVEWESNFNTTRYTASFALLNAQQILKERVRKL